MSNPTNEARELLRGLKQRLVSGEIDREEFSAQRDLILADLSPGERAELGVTTAPPTPSPGGSRVGPASGRFGPSGGLGGGARTTLDSVSELELEPGKTILGQWTIVRELGRGGFGAVFEAEEMHLHEVQAVKVLDPSMVAREDLLARFRREVSLMRKLIHPRIVRVFDYREDPDQLVALISMELVRGGSVRDLVAAAQARRVAIPIALAVAILSQTLEALVEAHRQGVIHRDVTPGNVLLAGGTPDQLLADPARDPQVKLVDFGIAGLVERSELSQKSRVLGTAAYVAPEILEPAGEVTPAADVYGAGAIAYEVLTGQLPLGRYESPRLLRAEILVALDALVVELLARQPAARPLPGQALERLQALSRPPVPLAPVTPLAVAEPAFSGAARTPVGALAAPPILDPAPEFPIPPQPVRGAGSATAAGRSRSSGPWIAIAAVVVAAAIGIGWVVTHKSSAPAEKDVAPAAAGTPAEDPAEAARRAAVQRQEEERQRTAAAQQEKADAERRARERIERYLDRGALAAGGPVALAVDSGGALDDTLTTLLTGGIGGSSDLFRPAFITDGLFGRAVGGDRSVLSELGLDNYPAAILLVRQEATFGADSLARDMTVASVKLKGRLFRGGRAEMVQGAGRKGDFVRERAVEKASAEAAEQLLAAMGQ